MKKIVIVLISILIVLFAALSIMDRGGEYAAEKLFYRAMKVNSRIMANPDVVPPKQLEYVENNIEKILRKYPKTETAKNADVTLTEFYITYKKYDEALAQADKVIKKYEKNTVILSTAYFLKGVAYEKQNKWPSALKQYHMVRDDYRDTQLGIQIPIYIASYYSQKGREADAKQAYGEAVRFYENIEKENSKKVLGYMASTLLVQTYIKSDDFESAARVIEETLDKYFSQIAVVQLLPLVENVIVTKLKNPNKAIEIYNKILAKSKDANLNKVLQKRIDALTGKGPVNVSKS